MNSAKHDSTTAPTVKICVYAFSTSALFFSELIAASGRGGNCELTKVDEVVRHNGVTIVGPSNFASIAPYHASQMYARNIGTFAKLLIKDAGIHLDEFIRGRADDLLHHLMGFVGGVDEGAAHMARFATELGQDGIAEGLGRDAAAHVSEPASGQARRATDHEVAGAEQRVLTDEDLAGVHQQVEQRLLVLGSDGGALPSFVLPARWHGGGSPPVMRSAPAGMRPASCSPR